MKICHLTSVHPHFDTRIFYKECCSLATQGYEVHLVAPNAPQISEAGVQIHSVPCTSNRLVRIFKTSKEVYSKAVAIDANLYHFHDPELVFVGVLLKLRGKKVIYDVHEDVPRQILSKYWIKKPLRKIISWLFEIIENWAAHRYDGIVTATPYINKRFLTLGCKTVNINNYPSINELHTTDRDWSQKEQSVCYVGGIFETRGVFQMIDAIHHTNTNLILAGTFSPLSLRKNAMNMPGWKHVIEMGQADRQTVKNIMSRSRAGLVVLHPIPNYIVSLPIKMFEYMSAGIPVICSNFPLWKEIIEKNQCGICVNPLDVDAIANAVQYIFDHPDNARIMGENGRRKVENEYNWEIESTKLFSLYKELLG